MEGFTPFAPRAVIVDDEPAIREYVAMVARQAGFEVDLAASGTELIDQLAEPFPHIIVLDLNMAHTDGVQVMRELARRKIDSRIVIFSGSDIRVIEAASEIARQHGLSIGAVLQKPVRKAALLKALERLGQESTPFTAATLQTCLDRKLISLNYQPKISLPTCEIIGCEALLRCVDPVGRPVNPEEVIAVAEGNGMIDTVTEQVFREAIEERRRWSGQGFDLGVAVNLSALSTFNQELPELFNSICAEHQVPTKAVTVELTESAVMDDRLLAAEAMVRLRLKGFNLSIDDFGTGYSSLLRLKHIPFTEMKVDKSFVIALHQSRDNAVIVKAIIQLARSLEMSSVVEGVEDKAALDFVAQCGCDEAQGYFIARPMSGADVPGLVKAWPWRQALLQQEVGGAHPAPREGVREPRLQS